MITGVVLARNEEANIVGCLTALRDHVEELIVIDMESTDRTVELARALSDQVLSHPLRPNFDVARNDAIPAAKYDWLWFVDADERVSPQVGQLVRQLITEQSNQFEAIVIPFKSYFCGQWMQHCGWWPGYTMPRVLKRGSFRFSERLHGGVESQGRQVRIPPDPAFGIDHFSYRSIEHYLEKLNRYTSTEAGQLAAAGAQWDWRDAAREMIRDLWVYYEHNPGHLDRERGWILSWLSGQYRWLARAKLIDLPTNPEQPPPFGGGAPSTLDEVLDCFQRELSALRAKSPKLPLGIVWRSPLFDPSGYADEARAFVKALASGDRPLRAEEIRWNDTKCDLSESDQALLKCVTRCERPTHIAAITDCIPTLVEPQPSAALNILRTTFETDRIPAAWLPHLAKFDQVWVPSQQNYRAFTRSGFPPECLRVVPSCYDENLYKPDGPCLELPPALDGRFVFLSVFDWQLRKGWDVLLRAYCQEFSVQEPVGLLLKVSRSHGHTTALIRAQADALLAGIGQSLVQRPDIVIWDQSLSAAQMAALYRSANAFVLPSRGEGWGRPYMEAMACGLDTIGTRHLGNADFMDEANSYLVDACLVAVPEHAAREIPPYRGHHWYEPDFEGLRQAMRSVTVYAEDRGHRAKAAARDLPKRFGLAAGREAISAALQEAEQHFAVSTPSAPRPDQVSLVLEGEFFAAHSFSNINEQLALQFVQNPRLALSLSRVQHQPAYDQSMQHAWRLRPYFGRNLAQPQITIRHAFPPNFHPPHHGLWVHMQPWEFGHLPSDWVEPLKSQVAEAWVPSQYVKRVFVQSGVPAEKVWVIPWGVDPEVFTPDAEPLLVPTEKSFRFLFVGGLIGRKGFDLLLDAYLQEFRPQDDVCLIVKDLGSQTYYRYGNFREQLRAAQADASHPAIVYLDQLMTNGQLASLYTACSCLAAPYRAEGFGLPILEAMACGLAPIVSRGGPTDDFTSEKTAYYVDTMEVVTTHDWQLAGPPLELAVSIADVRRALRHAYEDRQQTRLMGIAASESVRERFTWQNTAALMTARIMTLQQEGRGNTVVATRPDAPRIAACIDSTNGVGNLAHALAMVTPFVDEVIVALRQDDRAAKIASEYGARVVLPTECNDDEKRQSAEAQVTAEWLFWLHSADRLSDIDSERIRPLVVEAVDCDELMIDLLHSQVAENYSGDSGKLRIFRRRICAIAGG